MTRRILWAEFAGTALLMIIGLSAIVVDFAPSSPIVSAVPSADLRRLLTGLVFAGGATAVVYSPLGRRSGGHINPAVTLAFLRLGKLTGRTATGYVLAQLAGALAGTLLVLLVWGRAARSVRLGVTAPGKGGTVASLLAEAAMTFTLMLLILVFVDRPRLMPFTAAAAGLLVAVLVFVEAPVSGTSLNPARSLAPATVQGVWSAQWIYLIAPPLGAVAAAVLYGWRMGDVACGKLFHDNRYSCHFIGCRYQKHGPMPPPHGSRTPTTGGRS